MNERYQLKRRLGSGGMAEVYLAESTGAEGFSKPVVVKRVLPHLAADERIAKMFLAEAMMAKHLHHQNVVEVFDVGRGADGLFIAMELVDGWDLGHVQATAAKTGLGMPAPLVAYIAVQVLSGLTHAYGRKLNGQPLISAHRDISPSNILVSREGEVKVADFGIAKLHDDHGLTEPGMVKGKLAYAALEVLRGEPATPASDEFSLGVSLYELLCNRSPFGEADAPARYVTALSNERPEPIPGLPPSSWAILDKMLSAEPLKRFADPTAVFKAWAGELARGGTPVTAMDLASYLKRLDLGPTPLQLPPQPTDVALSMKGAAWITAGDLSREWKPMGPELDASGRLTGPPTSRLKAMRRDDPDPPATAAEPPEVGRGSSGWMEPASPEAPPEAPEAESSRGPSRWLAVVVLLIGVAAGAAWYGPKFLHRAALPLSVGGAHMLTLGSDPSGATVRINGNPVGQTPLFIDNIYPPGDVRLEMRLNGYRAWTGTFQGAQDQKIDARLKR